MTILIERMVLPAVKLNQIYSIEFANSVEVVFSDVSALDVLSMSEFLDSKQKDEVILVRDAAILDIKMKTLRIAGYKLDDKKWIVSKSGGSFETVQMDCSEESLRLAIFYLHHMFHNLTQSKN